MLVSQGIFPKISPSPRASLFFLPSLCLLAPEKARLEELKVKLASESLKGSAKQMYPIDFEKVGQACSETSAVHTAEATDRLAAHS